MKKRNLMPMALCLLLLAGCAAKPKTFEEMTVAERIEAATNFSGIIACLEDRGKYNSNHIYTYTDEETDELFEKIKTFLFTEGNITGTYYYNEKYIPGTTLAKAYGTESSYTVVLYSVSGDEIYLMPAEDAPKNVQDIPNMSNAAEYRYQAIRDDYLGGLDYDGEGYLSFDLQRISDEYEISVYYYSEKRLLEIKDRLPQKSNDISSYQDYYADRDTSLSASQAEYDKMVAEKAAKEEAKNAADKLAKSEPKIGMTKAEVESCAWGSPDKKNIDTYSWGTEEQWVYRSKGYVYFKNGVVSSVSKR